MRFLVLCLPLAALSGCIVVDNNHGTPPPPACTPPAARSSGNYAVYEVRPKVGTALPAGDIGYLLTANGAGTFSLVWTDTLNSPACFGGILSTNGTFSGIQQHTGLENVSTPLPNEIHFASTPGADQDGIDFTSSVDPIYLDAYIDGSLAVNIYYTDTVSGVITTAASDPAAFKSP
jgi:hypothetical protein